MGEVMEVKLAEDEVRDLLEAMASIAHDGGDADICEVCKWYQKLEAKLVPTTPQDPAST